MARTGVFGGTFDPPHLGHLVVAQDLLDALRLDRLLMIPAARPPHKQDVEPAPAELRYRMVEAAVGGHPRIEASRLELDREGPSYTVDTLRALGAGGAGDELFLAIGVDQLRAFRAWRAPDEIARIARIVVMARDGVEPGAVGPDPGVPYETVRVTRVDVSSTEIRERIREGRSVRYRVPEAVREIIQSERLYASDNEREERC